MKPILFFICFFVTANTYAGDYSGQWRGLLQLSPQGSIVLGFNIQQTDDGLTVLIDSPNQGMHDHQTSSAAIDGNTLKLSALKLDATFEGKFDGEKLVGTFLQRKAFPITLERLSAEQLQKLANETSWHGDLVLSKRNKLPLVLHVAVGATGYHVTLDSPKQKSFGIPINQFSLDDDALTFTSKLINASYKGSWKNSAWHGTFVQGSAMPLILKRAESP